MSATSDQMRWKDNATVNMPGVAPGRDRTGLISGFRRGVGFLDIRLIGPAQLKVHFRTPSQLLPSAKSCRRLSISLHSHFLHNRTPD